MVGLHNLCAFNRLSVDHQHDKVMKFEYGIYTGNNAKCDILIVNALVIVLWTVLETLMINVRTSRVFREILKKSILFLVVIRLKGHF